MGDTKYTLKIFEAIVLRKVRRHEYTVLQSLSINGCFQDILAETALIRNGADAVP